MLWKFISVFANNESPIVVVLTESMSPGFERGDILFLENLNQDYHSGDIPVFSLKGKEIPIVHRIIKTHTLKDSNYILTKGDNNEVHDRGLYNRGQKWLLNENIVGKVRG